MIQVYKISNTNYQNNGDITLLPSSAITTAELNGSWYSEMEHPIDQEGRWKYIVEGATVKMPSFNGDQLYRIKTVSKSDSEVTATMEPIFYDSIGDCFLIDVRPTAKTGQEALDIMLAANSKYSGSSNISKSATAYYQYMNFMEALNGDADQSFVNRWGGEILFDNFSVIVNERIGADYGVELRYGKNIPKDGLKEDIDVTDVVTRIYPKAYNGYAMSNNGYVDSNLINTYPTVHAVTMTFEDVKMRADASEDDEENGVLICDSQAQLDIALEQRCQEQYEAGIDKPKVTISADMVLLQNTTQYKDYQVLETVSLGDTVHIIHNRLGIITDARVIELEYDSIRKRVASVVIGDFKANYFDGVTSSIGKIDKVVRPDGTVVAEQIAGFIDATRAQLHLQSTAAAPVEGIAFRVEDLDPDNDTYGAMVWGTQGIQISKQRTADGRDWDWTAAMTANGIIADTIVAGTISDRTGRNYWNLDTGEFSLSSAAFAVDGEEFGDYVGDLVNDKIGSASIVTLQLTNDYAAIATDADGNGGDFSGCSTTAQLFYGTTDVSGAATYSATPSDGVSGGWNAQTRTYTVTGMITDQGEVTIQATWDTITVSKVFTIVKQKQGDPGRSYHMELSAKVIKKDSNGDMYPSQIEIALKYIDGQSSDPKDYFGKIKIEETTDGASYTQKYLSSSLEYGHTYTPSDSASSIRVTMYSSSGTQVLDIETVAVLVDVDNLTQEQVFDILTDGGRIQGIFMQDGQLYFNGQYMKMHSIYTDALNVGIGGNLYYCGYDTLEHITNDTLYYNLGGNTGVVAIASVNNYGPGSQYDHGIIPPYGTKSIRLITSGSTDTWMYLGSSQNDYGCIPVTAGKTYRLSCYVRVLEELVTDNIPCQLYVVGHTSINNVNTGHPASTSFTAVKSEWTRPYVDYTADGTYPYISVRIDADAPSTTFWCCFQIEEITSDEQETSPFRPAGTLVVNGANMLIGSIGADKISINDLVALNATIGKWHIAENYLWSEYTTGRYSVIKSNGDVMIATNSPSSTDTTGATGQLWHDGHITVGDTAGGGIRTEIYGDTFDMYNQGGYAFQLNYNGGMELWGNADGNPTPYIDFHYDGSQQDYSVRLICNGPDSLSVEGGTLNTGSDEVLKKDMAGFDKRMETFFRAVNPIYFRYQEDTDKLQFGYSANNIEDALVAAGFDADDVGIYYKDVNGIRSLAINGMEAPNTYMIQRCMERIAALETLALRKAVL